MEDVRLDLPRMSSSEEITFKTCRLAHEFGYVLGYAPVITNQKLSIGIGLHECLEAVYLGEPWKMVFENWAAERWAELVAGGISDRAEVRMQFVKDKAMVVHLVEGYIEWAAVNQIDAGWEVVEVEAKHYIDVGAVTLLPMKFDLLLRHTETGALKLVDFKTAAGFSADAYTTFQLAEQTLNYAMGVFALYGQIPEVEYRQLRKVNRENANSKPPYFRAVNITVTKAEIIERQAEYGRIAEERADPDRRVYSNPSACCGSWKNDWQGPCLLVHQGFTPLEALEASSKYAPKDPYERYEDTEVPSGN
jgi:hypothetical protein